MRSNLNLFTALAVCSFGMIGLTQTVHAQGQGFGDGFRVSQQVRIGNKVYLELDLLMLEAQLDSLFSATSGDGGASTLNWSDVLTNGNSPGMNVNFDSYNAYGLGDLTAAGTLNADSLVLAKDAAITGRLGVSGVTAVGDSLTVSGFVEFSDSLNVVKAVAVGQTLFVTGVTSLGDSLHVAGNVDFDALFNVDGAATFGSTLTVTGVTSLNDSLHVTGNADFDGDVNIDGDLDVNAAMRVNSIELGGGDATGNATIARGVGAEASGDYSTALDSLAIARGLSSKALGRESKAYGADATALGFQSEAADSAAWSSAGYGWNSVALGARSKAYGTHSYALGDESEVNSTATNAYALGYGSKVGVLAHFSLAYGHSSEVSGSGSVALGYGAKTIGVSNFAMAFGYGSTAGNNSAMTFGYQSSASMFHAMAFGQSATASGVHSLAFANASTASGDQSVTFGRNSTASGPHAFAMGEGSTASGWNSRAFGRSAIASGPQSFAFGESSTASGYNSLAFGNLSSASYGHAIALGHSATASQYNTVAQGYQSIASGAQSFVQAAGSEANSLHESIFGAYSDNTNFSGADALNWVDTDPLFIVGNGSSATARSNALVIRKDGAAMFSDSMHVAGHVTLGDQLSVTGVTSLNDSVHIGGALDVSNNYGNLSVGRSQFIPQAAGVTSFGMLNHNAGLLGLTENIYDISVAAAMKLELSGIEAFGPMMSEVDRASYYQGLTDELSIELTAQEVYDSFVSSVGSGQITTASSTILESTPGDAGDTQLSWARDTMMMVTNQLILLGDSTHIQGELLVTGETRLNDSLHVNSGVRIADGTQGAGKVLTSDANGYATWQTPSTSGSTIPFNTYEAWIDHASIVSGVTASTTSAHMFVDSTSIYSADPQSYFSLSAGGVTVSTTGYYDIEGYLFGSRSTLGSGFITGSVTINSNSALPQCTSTEQWAQTINSSVRTNCRLLLNAGDVVKLNVIEQSGGTSTITDAGLRLQLVGTYNVP